MRLDNQSSTEFRYRAIVKMYKAGKTQKEIAALLECSQAWVSKVLKKYKAEGDAIFEIKGAALGRKPLLNEAKMNLLKGLLEKGALVHGFETNRWTQERIADLIELHFGVKYHQSHISRLMQRIKFPLQKREEKKEKKDSASIDTKA